MIKNLKKVKKSNINLYAAAVKIDNYANKTNAKLEIVKVTVSNKAGEEESIEFAPKGKIGFKQNPIEVNLILETLFKDSNVYSVEGSKLIHRRKADLVKAENVGKAAAPEKREQLKKIKADAGNTGANTTILSAKEQKELDKALKEQKDAK